MESRPQIPRAATLLVSVEPRSTPDGCGLVFPSRHRPARPGGAVFHIARLVTSLGEPRPTAMNIAPRWQAAWWRRRSIRWSGVLVLNTARRRQAPPWRPTHRSPDPLAGLNDGLLLRPSRYRISRGREKKRAASPEKPSHPGDGPAWAECPAAKSTANTDCRRIRRAVN